jgi:hypothetical protein
MTPSGIEPATFRFVAQYLNHCATISGPQIARYQIKLFGTSKGVLHLCASRDRVLLATKFQ